jgi:hypothetical protein
LSRKDILNTPPEYVTDVRITGDRSAITLERPAFYGQLPRQILEVARKWETDPTYVAEIQDVQLFGPHATSVCRDGRYLLESVEGGLKRLSDELVRTVLSGQVPSRRHTSREYEALISLVGPWSEEFFHWFADYLPRLRPFENDDGNLQLPADILIPRDPPSFVEQSLDLIGVPQEHRVRWDGSRTNVSKLIVPSVPHHTYETSGYIQFPEELIWVRDRLVERVRRPVDTDDSHRLYVSRRNQQTRTVSNEEEILPILDKYDFELVTPEDWSVSKQVSVFSQADIVAGPHGAGLLNAIYNPECTLVELFGNEINPCYYTIAESLGLGYVATQCRENPDGIIVSPDEFEHMLREVVDSST